MYGDKKLLYCFGGGIFPVRQYVTSLVKIALLMAAPDYARVPNKMCTNQKQNISHSRDGETKPLKIN